jgi:hypothetical protein
MSTPSRLELSIFERLAKNPFLSPAVKLWFMLFKLSLVFDEIMSIDRIRDVFAWTLDEDAFIAEIGGWDFANSIRKSHCVKCGYIISGNFIREVRGTCGHCNNIEFGIVPEEEKQMAWYSVYYDATHAPCFCCSAPISSDCFSAAHIRAAMFCGPPMRFNIRPTCFSCNDAMGVTNLTIFHMEIFRITQMLELNPYLLETVLTRWEDAIKEFGIRRR